jgi:hypothetical protein
MTPRTPSRRPFSPFLRLLLGAASTLLLAEFARFQADLAWAALPVGAGLVITLASVGRGMRERRAWRRAQVAARAAQADGAAGEELPVPKGAGASPLEDAPHDVAVRRREPVLGWPNAPLIDARDLSEPVLARGAASDPGPDDGGALRPDDRAYAEAPVERD